MGQVAAGAEDDHIAGLRHPFTARVAAQGVIDDCRGCFGHNYSVLTSCPPNSLRITAMTLAAKDASWRDLKRSSSETSDTSAIPWAAATAASDRSE